jgi:hypothetical protein
MAVPTGGTNRIGSAVACAVMTTVARVAAFLAGMYLAGFVLLSAIRTVVLPRGEPVALTRALFVGMRRVFDLRLRHVTRYEDRDRRMAMYAPLTLMSLPILWVALVMVGFTGMFWGLGVDPLRDAFFTSGSNMLTLGLEPAPDFPTHLVAFVEATFGLGVVALLISYLPSIYASFQRRELLVARLATRAGTPPSAIDMIIRHGQLKGLDSLDDMWDTWETWFADIEETHTSQPSLVFFRSISHDRSWVNAAGVVLDAASFRAAVLNMPSSPDAQLCIRSGYLCLRRIAGYFDLPFPSSPRRGDSISISRDEFNEAYERLAREGVPLRPDRELAWQDFAGWRVNYDAPLLALASLTMAPYAVWTSDRSIAVRYPAVFRRPQILRWRPRLAED